MNIKAITSVKEITGIILEAKQAGKSIGFVPTMGALHSGHQSLIEKANFENDIVVCSIFVNPTQFNNPIDLASYPRMTDQDIRLLESNNCDYVFLPSVEEMYPQGQITLEINFGWLEETMEGRYRPGHFRGMATIVDRLFTVIPATRAYFGEKDFQQLAIVRALVKMRNHHIEIIGCPTLREPDGLAMSSRNLLLSPDQRKAAPKIFQALQKAHAFIPFQQPAAIRDLVIRYIDQSLQLHVQYFELVDPLTLEPVTKWNPGSVVQGCVAVLTEGPRLIDNIAYKA